MTQDGCKYGRQTTGDTLGPFYKPNSPIQHLVGNEVPSICVNTPGNFRLYLNGTVRLNRLVDICGFPTKALMDV
ncbi:hypothetical protein RvY_00308 [Ramazzottius varieornatus]|uniref:Uncharacterized protein n=1 Tax=Ramazzottius varieornatus TaxID=947166 RepID=A0A1D1UM96_RAMVA|nr:hypothetical protein RvY_00308 [Ramazzottius varieornatus]